MGSWAVISWFEGVDGAACRRARDSNLLGAAWRWPPVPLPLAATRCHLITHLLGPDLIHDDHLGRQGATRKAGEVSAL